MRKPGFVAIFGATSAIARAVARELAATHSLLLVARDEDELLRIAQDLRLRTGAPVGTIQYDALGDEPAVRAWERCLTLTQGAIDGVVLCQGTLGDRDKARNDPAELRKLIAVNADDPSAFAMLAASHMEPRKYGFIVGFGSVAGDRGRQSNYAYGAAKAAFHTMLSGLRQRLYAANVHVLTVKPGFVDTSMTWGLEGMFLVASPQAIARDVTRAIRKRRDVLYTPWFWRWILLVIRNIPERVFKRMKI